MLVHIIVGRRRRRLRVADVFPTHNKLRVRSRNFERERLERERRERQGPEAPPLDPSPHRHSTRRHAAAQLPRARGHREPLDALQESMPHVEPVVRRPHAEKPHITPIPRNTKGRDAQSRAVLFHAPPGGRLDGHPSYRNIAQHRLDRLHIDHLAFSKRLANARRLRLVGLPDDSAHIFRQVRVVRRAEHARRHGPHTQPHEGQGLRDHLDLLRAVVDPF
mmetsp:Transcript_19919/g.51768  ORF Transcript_19919/g.51768 Transcript_19919/m.51768 type:complete len:220 (+) Transcript_19919:13-672(+)